MLGQDQTAPGVADPRPAPSRLIAVTPDNPSLRWQPARNYGFLKQSAPPELALAELDVSVANFPIVVQKAGRDFRVLSLIAGPNGEGAYLTEDGRLTTNYVPAAIRAYPFCLIPDAEGVNRLCLNQSDEISADPSSAESAFDDAGKPTDRLQKVIDLLGWWVAGRKQAQDAAKSLATAGLLEKLPDNTTSIASVYTIDAEKFAQRDLARDPLDTDTTRLAHALLFSRPHLSRLQLSERPVAQKIAAARPNDSLQQKGIDFMATFASASERDALWSGEGNS